MRNIDYDKISESRSDLSSGGSKDFQVAEETTDSRPSLNSYTNDKPVNQMGVAGASMGMPSEARCELKMMKNQRLLASTYQSNLQRTISAKSDKDTLNLR